MDVNARFFDRPVLNSPYEYPARHRELAKNGQPTNRVLDRRRQVSFITPIPKPKKRTGAQQAMVFAEEARRIAGDGQQYELAQTINSIRNAVDRWRALPDPGQWRVTPETARLLNHWRHHEFSRYRPFFWASLSTLLWYSQDEVLVRS